MNTAAVELIFFIWDKKSHTNFREEKKEKRELFE